MYIYINSLICMVYVNCAWNNIVNNSYCNSGLFVLVYLSKNPILRVTSILIYVQSS